MKDAIRTMRILVVEDEKRLASYIKKGLEENSFAVDLAFDKKLIHTIKGVGYILQE